MPKIHLTDISVQRLKDTDTYFDLALSNFAIRVGKHRKTWIVIRGRERSRTRIGTYPSTTLAEARKKAHALLGAPLAPKRAPTFPGALDQFLDTHGATLKARSKYVLERSLRHNFHWTKTLDKITHEDVAALIDGIEAKSAACHALKDIRTFFNWCVPRYIPFSPCIGLKMPGRYVRRKRVLSDVELKKVWDTATDYPFGHIVRLLILNANARPKQR